MQIKKILWTVDVEAPAETINSAGKMVMALSKASGAEVVAVNVLNLAEMGLVAYMDNATVDEFKNDNHERLNFILKRFGFAGLGKVIQCNKRGLSQSAQEVIKLGKRLQSDLIVTSSRNTSALGKFFLGSFADAIIFHSDVPVLMVRPGVQTMPKIKNILMATDLDEQCDSNIQSIIPLATQLKAGITLFHYYGLGRPSKKQPEYVLKQLDEAKEKMQALKAMLEAQKIKVKTDIKLEDANLTKSIIDSAKKNKADIIVVKGKVDKLRSMLIGSTSRAVAQYAPYPVLIMH